MAPGLLTSIIATAILLSRAIAAPTSSYIDWKRYKANGVNLGGWLVQEAVIDPTFWSKNCGDTTDEWNCCAELGSQCGPVLERRYTTYITTSDIDELAAAGINTLRIPTTYAGWIELPGSELYSGNQIQFLTSISQYAIEKYDMHVIVDLHSLPGGVNGMGLGGGDGQFGWFQNQTNLDYSWKAVDAVISFIQGSGTPQSYTLDPINEPVDNIASFGFPASLTDAGAAWVLKYVQVSSPVFKPRTRRFQHCSKAASKVKDIGPQTLTRLRTSFSTSVNTISQAAAHTPICRVGSFKGKEREHHAQWSTAAM